MKINKLSVPALLALSLAFAACSNDENLVNGENDNVAIRVSGGITADEGAMKVGSRAAGSAWEAGDAIGIFMLNGTAVDTYSNIKYVTTDNSGVFNPQSTTIYLPVDGSGRDFVAYYPYDGVMEGSTYSINLNNQTDQSAIDFMTSEKENGTLSTVKGIAKTNPDVKFRFHHMLSKVSLIIKTGNGFTGDNTELAGLIVKLTGQNTEGTCDVLNDNAVTATGSTDKTIELLTAADGLTSEAIVMPADNFNGMKLQFETVNSGNYEWSLASSTEADKFEPGKEYKYTITINKTSISVTTTIADWESGNGSGDTGSAE